MTTFSYIPPRRKGVPSKWKNRFNRYKSHRVPFELDASVWDLNWDFISSLEGISPQKHNRLLYLWGNLYSYAKSDKVEVLKSDSFTYEGFSVPENTHHLKDLDEGDSEVWSKDISWEERLIYRIIPKEKRIELLSWEGHDLDKEENSSESRRSMSKTYSMADRKAERQAWLEAHKHWSKQAQQAFMPLHLKDDEVYPLSPETLKAIENCEKASLNVEPPVKMPPLTEEELRKNGILGELL